MAKCSRCGKPAGMFSNLCDECKELGRREELARLAKEEEQNRQKRERVERERQAAIERHRAFREDLIAARAAGVLAKVEAGQRAFLYDVLYLPVDSVVLGKKVTEVFTLGDLRQRGLDGWEIVVAVPVTVGVALTNVSAGSTFGET
jgi:hypothetical protein